MMSIDGIAKPAFNVFAALHHLGDRRLGTSADSTLITARRDGTIVVALWNYAPPDGIGAKYTAPGTAGPTKHFDLRLQGMRGSAHATLLRVDNDHGNVLRTYDAMGRPPDLSPKQIDQLRKDGHAAPPESASFHNGELAVDVPAHGLVVMEIH